MSGWRSITVQVGDRRKGVLPVARLLDKQFETYVITLDDAEYEADEVVDTPKQPERGNPLVIDNNRVVLTLRGYNRIPPSGHPKKLLPACLTENTAHWEMASATGANDTTDSGRTALFRADGETPTLLDVKHGEEAMFMRDVVKYFEEEYGFEPAIRATSAGYVDHPLLYST